MVGREAEREGRKEDRMEDRTAVVDKRVDSRGRVGTQERRRTEDNSSCRE